MCIKTSGWSQKSPYAKEGPDSVFVGARVTTGKGFSLTHKGKMQNVMTGSGRLVQIQVHTSGMCDDREGKTRRVLVVGGNRGQANVDEVLGKNESRLD